MKSNVQTVLDLFESKRRYIVPLFQRQYVWSLDKQWTPLWEDIERRVTDRMHWYEVGQGPNSKSGSPGEHFLGAIVLDHHPTFGKQVPTHLLIDGQQRLATCQIILAALRDVATKLDVPEYPAELQRHVLNTGVMETPDLERYKVWPSRFDRDAFQAVIEASVAELPGPKSRLVHAYQFFSRELEDLLLREILSARLGTQPDTYERVKAMFEVFQKDLQIVTIELESQDDPQVIFESLNARGEPLLPSDLLRNYLFWRASREDARDLERLYGDYWGHFDSDFWKKDERQGRLKRPRVDLFFFNLLQLKTGEEVNAGRLYYEYKTWSENTTQYEGVSDELQDIHRYSLQLEKVFLPNAATPIGRFAQMLQIFDVKTVNSLLLGIVADGNLSDDEVEAILVDLESYLVRRAICGMTAQNYNRLFVSWMARLNRDGISRERLHERMLAGESDSGVWPDDARLHESWLNEPLYRRLYSRRRLEYILRRLEMTLRTSRHERVTIESGLTVEHVLPQEWTKHWRLPDGSKGVPSEERLTKPSPDSDARDRVLQTIGNLTLLTGPLNSTNQNREFEYKVRKIKEYSLLALNGYFRQRVEKGKGWDEEAIQERGRKLFKQAVRIWPHPGGRGAR